MSCYVFIKSSITLMIFAVFLSSCKSNSIQTASLSTHDKTAMIHDTCEYCRGKTGNFYFIESINNKDQVNLLNFRENAYFTGVWKNRLVQTEELLLQLSGVKVASKDQANTIIDSKISFKLRFKPEPNQHYFVRGAFLEDQASIWIENLSGQQVSDKLIRQADTYRRDSPSIAQSSSTTNDSKTSMKDWFNGLSYGESESLVLKKLGQPNRIEKKKNGVFDYPEIKILFYDHLGELTFHRPFYDQFYLCTIEPRSD